MPRRKGAHLDYDDRCCIEDMLKQRASFREIARRLGVSPTTVSNEVRRNRTRKSFFRFPAERARECLHYWGCSRKGVCGSCDTPGKHCKLCGKEDCCCFCPAFEQRRCPLLEKPPYVCGGCPRSPICDFGKAHYVARHAQEAHERRASCAHAGVSCSPSDLKEMVSKVRSLLERGHSLEAIWAAHGGEFPVSVRTFYTYIDNGLMGLANIELPKKVRYRARRKGGAAPRMSLEGRTYRDWLALPEERRVHTVQVDTIEGRRSDRKAVLSLHFPYLMFQIYMLLPQKAQACVASALDSLELCCEGAFPDVFGTLLADRGSEFLDYGAIERSCVGESSRCSIFYCDPMKPAQKGACEKNHVEFRKVVPKGASIDRLTQEDVALVCSHVNSYPRAARRQAPIVLAKVALPGCLLEGLGIEEIAPDEVVMTPQLLER